MKKYKSNKINFEPKRKESSSDETLVYMLLVGIIGHVDWGIDWVQFL